MAVFTSIRGDSKQPAKIGAASINRPSSSICDTTVSSAWLFVGMGVERRGISIGEAAARSNGRSLRSHFGFHMLGRAAKGTWHGAGEYQDRPAEPAQGV